MTRLYGWEYITAREYGRMTVWVHGCMIVEMYRCMYAKCVPPLKLRLVAGRWGVYERGHGAQRTHRSEHHRCKRNDHHHRPELGAVRRHIHKSSGRSAHRCKRKNSRHRVSQAKMRRQKVSDTAIYTGTAKGTAHRTKRHSYSQRHRQKGSRP